MQKSLVFVIAALIAGSMALRASRARSAATQVAAPTSVARFTSDGKLVRPEGYRRWAYVSSGFGMSYNPNAGGNGAPAFTNVFVDPEAYDYFRMNGRWPDRAIFVLEIYASTSRGSINQKGSYQESLLGLDVEIKDAARFKVGWAYFGFDSAAKTASAMTPGKNACWTCHEQHAAVEHSFVQFYPELLNIARERGTVKARVSPEERK